MVRVTLIVDKPTMAILDRHREAKGAFIRESLAELMAELELPKKARAPIEVPAIVAPRRDLKVHIPLALRRDAEAKCGPRKPFTTFSEMVRTAVARASA